MISRKTLIVIALIITLVSCGGSSSSESAGTSLALDIQHSQSNNTTSTAAGTKQFRNSEGVHITFDKAYLVQWSIEVVSDCSDSSFVRLPDTWLDFFFSTAAAHALEEPTRLSVPHVLDLTGRDNLPIRLGEISPPVGTYCGLKIELFPADEDAMNLPVDTNMLNKTLHIEGTYSVNGSEPINFLIESNKKLSEKGLVFSDRTLTLDNTNRQATQHISIIYDRWFDGVNFEQLDSTQTENQLLTNIRNSIALI